MSKKKKGKTLILDAEATEVFLDVFEAINKERTKEIIRRVKEKRRVVIPADTLKLMDEGKSCQKQTKK